MQMLIFSYKDLQIQMKIAFYGMINELSVLWDHWSLYNIWLEVENTCFEMFQRCCTSTFINALTWYFFSQR